LANLDVLVFDIQDIGTRFYTYISTLRLVLEEAAKGSKKVFAQESRGFLREEKYHGKM